MSCRLNGPFKIAHLNTQSILDKVSEIQHFLLVNQIDIISFNETWLNKNKKLKLHNYKTYRLDRQTRGGGVCIAVHESIIATIVEHNFQNKCMIIKLPNHMNTNEDIYISSYYNTQSTTINESLLNYIFELGNNVILLGDLNAHSTIWHSNHDDNSGEIIIGLINNRDLVLLNDDSPTYVPLHHTFLIITPYCTVRTVREQTGTTRSALISRTYPDLLRSQTLLNQSKPPRCCH
jgi:Endonuclease-reverse transcriptase